MDLKRIASINFVVPCEVFWQRSIWYRDYQGCSSSNCHCHGRGHHVKPGLRLLGAMHLDFSDNVWRRVEHRLFLRERESPGLVETYGCFFGEMSPYDETDVHQGPTIPLAFLQLGVFDVPSFLLVAE